MRKQYIQPDGSIKIETRGRKTGTKVGRQHKRPEDYKVNPNQFMIPLNMTPEAAYLLGFLYADGNLAKQGNVVIRAEFTKSDFDTIEHIFDTTGDWNKTSRQRLNRKEQMIVYTCCGLLWEYLKIESNWFNVPDHLISYWIHGYFDGDGCAYYGTNCRQIYFTGPYEHDWKPICNFLDKMGIKKYSIKSVKVKNGNKYSYLRFVNLKDIYCLYRNLYNNKLIGFPRKYIKIKKMINDISPEIMEQYDYLLDRGL